MSLVTKLSSEPLFFFLHLSYPAFSAFITLMTLCGRTSLWLFLPTGLPFPWGQHLDYCCSSRSWMTYFKDKEVFKLGVEGCEVCTYIRMTLMQISAEQINDHTSIYHRLIFCLVKLSNGFQSLWLLSVPKRNILQILCSFPKNRLHDCKEGKTKGKIVLPSHERQLVCFNVVKNYINPNISQNGPQTYM